MMAVIVKTNMEHQKLLTAIDKSGYTPENCVGKALTVYVSKNVGMHNKFATMKITIQHRQVNYISLNLVHNVRTNNG